jgi:hypothetical protein
MTVLTGVLVFIHQDLEDHLTLKPFAFLVDDFIREGLLGHLDDVEADLFCVGHGDLDLTDKLKA